MDLSTAGPYTLCQAARYRGSGRVGCVRSAAFDSDRLNCRRSLSMSICVGVLNPLVNMVPCVDDQAIRPALPQLFLNQRTCITPDSGSCIG